MSKSYAILANNVDDKQASSLFAVLLKNLIFFSCLRAVVCFTHGCFTLPLSLSLTYLVEDIGVEPMTPCVQGRCSSQLS